jgi:hypothetical protein
VAEGKNHDFCSNSAACAVKRQVGGEETGDRICGIMMYLYRVIHIEKNPDI